MAVTRSRPCQVEPVGTFKRQRQGADEVPEPPEASDSPEPNLSVAAEARFFKTGLWGMVEWSGDVMFVMFCFILVGDASDHAT
jgi:hypothetical protein